MSALSARDPGGQWLRVVLVAAALTLAVALPQQFLAPGTLLVWLVASLLRNAVSGYAIVSFSSVAELSGLAALALSGSLLRNHLQRLEESAAQVFDDETGTENDRLLRATLEREIARSRRFGHQFSLMMVGLDERRLRFDRRGDQDWRVAFQTTASLLRSSRANIDRIFRHGQRTFALILPETGPSEVTGMIRRLNRLARAFSPSDHEPEGPTPINFGVTFYHQAAITAVDLIRRAEVALRLAEKSPSRVRYDGAEAPDLPAPDSLRRLESDEALEEPAAPGTVAASEGTPPGTETPPLRDAIGGLLNHLDDTLEYLRKTRVA